MSKKWTKSALHLTGLAILILTHVGAGEASAWFCKVQSVYRTNYASNTYGQANGPDIWKACNAAANQVIANHNRNLAYYGLSCGTITLNHGIGWQDYQNCITFPVQLNQ